MPRLLVATSLILALACACCDGSNTTPAFSSGLDATAPLNGLTKSDRDQLCDRSLRWAQSALPAAEVQELMCRISAVFSADPSGADPHAQSKCATTYRQCLSTNRSPAATPTGSCAAPSSACDATVGALESCMNQLPAYMKHLDGVLPTCSQLASSVASLGTLADAEGAVPAACKAVDNRCPGLTVPGRSTLPLAGLPGTGGP